MKHPDPDAIRHVAGSEYFERGKALLERAQFHEFHTDEHSASGQVEVDNMTCHTRIRLSAGRLEGECSCPVSEGFEFCEHCVALALYAGNQARRLAVLRKGNDSDKIRSYLLSMDKNQLATLASSFIRQDPDLMTRYLVKANLEGPAVDFNAVKKQITHLTRLPEKLFTQKQVQFFFQRIQPLAEGLSSMERTTDPVRLGRLIDYLLDRIDLALSKIPETYQSHQPTTNLLAPIALRLSIRACRKPETLAKNLFRLWLKDHHDIRQLAPAHVLPSLPEHHRASYEKQFLSLCRETWQTLATVTPEQPISEDRAGQPRAVYLRLRGMLLASPDARENPEIRLDIRAKYIEHESEYLSLARLAAELGQAQRAIQWYQAYLRWTSHTATGTARASTAFDADLSHRDLPQEALNELCDLLATQPLTPESLPYFWQRFEQQPTLEDWQRILDSARQEGHAEEATEKAHTLIRQWVRSREDKIPIAGWKVLVTLLPEDAFTIACRLSGGPQLGHEAILFLADHGPDDTPDTARLLQTAIEQAIQRATRQDLAFIEHALERLKTRLEHTEFRQYVEALIIQHPFRQTLRALLAPYLADPGLC